MHIGLIIYGRLDTLTGGWIYDRLMVEYLQARGHTVEVISLKQRNYVYNLADNFSRSFYRRLLNHDCRLLLQDGLIHPSLVGLNQRIKRRRSCPPDKANGVEADRSVSPVRPAAIRREASANA